MSLKKIPDTHVRLSGTELDRLHRALENDCENVFFARDVNDPSPWPSYLMLLKPFSRASDPIETGIRPICGYNFEFDPTQLAMNGNTGEIVMRQTGQTVQVGGWKPPITNDRLFAYVPKEVQ